MKKLAVLFLMMCVSFVYSQDTKEPKLEKIGDQTFITYYHDNGEISQTGMFNADGKVHGEWKSFDAEGNKLALGNYDNGKKVGKWFFWQGNSLKEVDYIDSKIVSVNQWDNKTKVALNNR
ncbi:toxin-antitoxin system YwqK family antitoxin [Winogradskyella tangerina]|uniref:toxin-antitoxin system YwqK family antitoxin n=1 Tax=Winogradskyella tangerina TaxID=2023240 RepID=UPI000DBE33B7|nr:nicotinic acid mononucleotide adenyltransferase [Winogradskyella tangerina]